MVPGSWKDVKYGSACEIEASKDVGMVDTIYEEEEEDEGANPPIASSSTTSSEEIRNVVMVMNMAYKGDEKKQKGRASSSSSAASALQRNIWAWCEATGLPTSVTVHVENCSFKLHKYPLVSKSGYFKRNLSKQLEITLTIPAEIFELVANFCYGSTILMDPFNIAALRCAAELLEMTEEYGKGNLCQRSDLYLTQVVLQSWEDTLVVLQKCEDLLPLAEEIHIVTRCIDSLACIACMEVVEPKQRISKSPRCQFWSDISTNLRQTTSREWWIKGLLSLSLGHFERIVASMRQQGMDEMIISRGIVQYGTKWILWEKRHQNLGNVSGRQEKNGSLKDLLECITRLLPMEGHSAPVDFLFSLLRVALGCNLDSEYKAELETRIASQLEYANIDSFLLPRPNSDTSAIFDTEVESMKRIVSIFIYQQSVMVNNSKGQKTSTSSCSFETVSTVADLWDEYLAQIAYVKRLNPSKFSELTAIFPPSARSTHDLLYKAIHTYFTAHPQLSHDERLSVCKSLKVQKLSQQACVHAVRNELMPLRLIVQAMFSQQVQTRKTIWSSSDSMQFEGSGNIDSLGFQRTSIPSAHFHSEYTRSSINEDDDGLPLGLILKRDAAVRQAVHLKSDYEATSLRLSNLEDELLTMKKTLEENQRESVKTRSILSGGKSESLRVVSTTKPVDTGCSKGFGYTFTNRGKTNGKIVHKLWKSFQKLGLRKTKPDQSKEIHEREPDSQVEVAAVAVEVNPNREQPQCNHCHRRNYSFS